MFSTTFDSLSVATSYMGVAEDDSEDGGSPSVSMFGTDRPRRILLKKLILSSEWCVEASDKLWAAGEVVRCQT